MEFTANLFETVVPEGTTRLKVQGYYGFKVESLCGLNLETLSIVGGYLSPSDLQKVGKFESLESLELIRCGVEKIEGLESLLRLESLNLSGNKIEKIEGLESLSRLRNLNLSGNNISKIEGLESLGARYGVVGFAYLNLSKNKIKKIEGLESFSSLYRLDLSKNKISFIEGLEALRELKELILSDNNISSLGGTECLSELETLDISYNRERISLHGLRELKHLRNLGINIRDISFIEEIGDAPWLNTVGLL